MGSANEASAVRWIEADWPAPRHVRALTTLRTGGCSLPPYASFNLSAHVGDRAEHVVSNRLLLTRILNLPAEPIWLEQHHGARIIDAAVKAADRRADGAYARQSGVVCAILTADCLPILLCDRAGREVAVLHGGWRGLAGGIIESGIARLRTPRAELLAWLGPAIGGARYEVGNDVRTAFLSKRPALDAAFTGARPGHYFCALNIIARRLLAECGVHLVYGGDHCTYSDTERFYSFRRDGQTGRVATLIWMEPTGR